MRFRSISRSHATSVRTLMTGQAAASDAERNRSLKSALPANINAPGRKNDLALEMISALRHQEPNALHPRRKHAVLLRQNRNPVLGLHSPTRTGLGLLNLNVIGIYVTTVIPRLRIPQQGGNAIASGVLRQTGNWFLISHTDWPKSSDRADFTRFQAPSAIHGLPPPGYAQTMTTV